MTVPIDYAHQNFNNSSHPSHDAVIAGYQLEQKLGSGSFATVYKARKLIDNESSGSLQERKPPRHEYAAVKAIERRSKKITKKVLENLDLEVSILASYIHPNIVGLHHVHKTENYFYLILEYCAGGDLQRLIRTRKSGRLTECLSRRLMRDLTAGLTFLANHNLIHRDIKPQNLLLTGPLPFEEENDPCHTEEEANFRQKVNFPSEQFHLKIADFGFARHLKKTSLAETLCGSPLYMAPEILQHRSYNNKADLWSAGTVLFEMIAGRPPFHGENHIDLLRNIQQKAVRLPPDLKVSRELVTLLRILLNRNPMRRAGFKDFREASDAFVGLGCKGIPATSPQQDPSTATSMLPQPQHSANLGPISEVEESILNENKNMDDYRKDSNASSSSSRTSHEGQIQMAASPPLQQMRLTPSPGPNFLQQPPPQFHQINTAHNTQRMSSHFIPLEPSPPGPRQIGVSEGFPPPLSLMPVQEIPRSHPYKSHGNAHSQAQYSQLLPLEQQHHQSRQMSNSPKKTESSQHSDDSSGGSGFVMVEKGSVNTGADHSTNAPRQDDRAFSRSHLTVWKQSSRRVVPASVLSGNTSPPTSPKNKYFPGKTILSSRNLIPPAIPFLKKGMLSTSPGTGGALVGMMAAAKNNSTRENLLQNDSLDLEASAKMLSAADDVGRRAINVAHVGDMRAYLAMRLLISPANDSISLHSSSGPMEGVEEEDIHRTASGHDCCTTINRARTISVDQSLSRRNSNCFEEEEEDDDEMPFAMPLEEEDDDDRISNLLAVQNTSGINRSEAAASGNNSKQPLIPTSTMILSHFREALSCYIKSLSMLKGSLNASQQILAQLKSASAAAITASGNESFLQFRSRCDVSNDWLSGQFQGVLERADAAKSEISKLTKDESDAQKTAPDLDAVSVEELIYNHSLACGKDGAVKQLLGQYETARQCYRSAGLLAETLLMEPKLEAEDKRTLEDYVQGFSERINEIDALMLQQSRHSISSGSTTRGAATGSFTSSRRGSRNSIMPILGK